jgi:hypothetical protein
MLYPKIKHTTTINHDTALMLLAVAGIHHRLRLLVMQNKFGKKQWSELESFSGKDLLNHPEGRYDGYKLLLNQDTDIIFDIVPMFLAMLNFNGNHQGAIATVEFMFDKDGTPCGIVACKGTDYAYEEPIASNEFIVRTQYHVVQRFLAKTDLNWGIPLSHTDYNISS